MDVERDRMSFVSFDTMAGGSTQLNLSIAPGFDDADDLLGAARGVADSQGDVVVDCENAPHLHPAILQLLVVLAHTLRGQARSFALLNVSPALDRFIALAGLTPLLLGNDPPLPGGGQQGVP